MSRTAATIWVLMALVPVAVVSGCGDPQGDRVAPVATDPGSQSGLAGLPAIPRSGGGAPRITFLLPNPPRVQPLIWKEAAQLDAAKKNVIFTVRTAGEGESMAELVRRVGREGTTALIVVVDDAEALGPAIAEARNRGIHVVTILEQVTADGEPVPVVVRGDYARAAEELVEAAAADATTLGKSAEGPALVIATEEFPEADRRAEALFEALTRAGIETIGEGPRTVSGGQYDIGEAVLETLKSRPELAMVLTGDDTSFLGATIERSELPEGTGLTVAGYLVDPESFDIVDQSFASAAAFADDRGLGILAFRNAMSLARGEAVPDRTVVPMPVRRAPGPPAYGRLRFDLNPQDAPLEGFAPTDRGQDEG
ncbi:substrate-binding domain-containing protein [Tautonia sp. JC769]|uniref:substrate-binding domain-containing protein n=1 Tax=Tautonia sp. JC769 TaxID=3232135 RepID=UPI00345B38CE